MKTGKLLQAKKIIPREKGLKKSHEKELSESVWAGQPRYGGDPVKNWHLDGFTRVWNSLL